MRPARRSSSRDRFPTATGRARLVPAGLSDPAELPDADYPFVLTTGRLLEHWHTGAMTRRAGVLDALEPAPTASLAPAALRRLGVAAGDRLRVATRRGAVELRPAPTPACRRRWSSSPSPIGRRRPTC